MSTESQHHRAEQAAMDILNKIWAENFGTTRHSRYRHEYLYYSPSNPINKSRAQDQYFYTLEKKNHNGSSKYISGVYRYNASKKMWKAMRIRGHAKKKDAQARALKLKDKNA